MNQSTPGKNVLLTLLGLAILVLLAVLFSAGPLARRPHPGAGPAQLAAPTVLPQDVKGVLTAFPADFPVEVGATVSQSYRYIPVHSQQQQATLEYISKKPAATTGKLYAAYFAKNHYQVINKIEKPDYFFYYGVKGPNDLSVQIAARGGVVVVSASYLRR